MCVLQLWPAKWSPAAFALVCASQGVYWLIVNSGHFYNIFFMLWSGTQLTLKIVTGETVPFEGVWIVMGGCILGISERAYSFYNVVIIYRQKLHLYATTSQLRVVDLALCGHCGAADCEFRCSGCKAVWYCGRDCQKAHRKLHKADCKMIMNLQSR